MPCWRLRGRPCAPPSECRAPRSRSPQRRVRAGHNRWPWRSPTFRLLGRSALAGLVLDLSAGLGLGGVEDLDLALVPGHAHASDLARIAVLRAIGRAGVLLSLEHQILLGSATGSGSPTPSVPPKRGVLVSSLAALGLFSPVSARVLYPATPTRTDCLGWFGSAGFWATLGPPSSSRSGGRK